MDKIIEKIGKIAETKTLMSMRKDLETLFKKEDIDFTYVGVPHFEIKHKGKTIIIVNKKYAVGLELIVNKIAIGYD